MPGSEIEALIEELEDLINNSKTPFSGGASRKIVDSEAVYEILDDIKQKLPGELEKARRILRERDEILNGATEQAEHIVEDAQARATSIASEQEIVRLAANMAEETRRGADADSRDIRYWAENSAEQTFAKLAGELADVIEKAKAMLEQTNYCRSLLVGASENGPEDAEPEPQDYADERDERYV